MRRFILAVLLVGLWVGLAISPIAQESSDIVRVPEDASTIQAAIDEVAEGGTILISAGTWTGNLVVEKRLILRGVGGHSDDVQIKAAGQGCPVILIRGLNPDSQVQLENLTITGASIGSCREDLSDATVGDGVGVLGNVNVIVSNVAISGNQNDGLHAQDAATVTVVNSRIADNGDTGLLALDEAVVDVFTSEIANNEAHGLGTSSSGDVRVFGSTLTDHGENGVIAIFSASVHIAGSRLVSNDGHGLYLRGMSLGKIFDTEIDNNTANGVYLEDEAEIELYANRIEGNQNVGLLTHSADCVDELMAAAEFNGTISGSANRVADNASGDVCPESLSFLTDVVSSEK